MATRARRKDAGSTQGEGPKHDHVFREFGGINTQAARQAIRPEEFSWIENIMPIGHGNLQVLGVRSASLQSVASGLCYYMESYNISDTNYMFMATDDGHLYQILLTSPFTRTEIGSGFSHSGVKIAQWKNERILIGDPSSGLWDWDGASLTHDAGTTDAPTAITSIETFSGRAWAAFGRTLFFSAPDSYVDWQTSSSGGSVIITDQTLHSSITQLLSANNFLYIFGVDSINVIGDLTVNATGDTIFTNTNLSASIGTDLDLTTVAYFRSVWLANRSGVYSIFGATPAKSSDALDGIFRKIDFSGGMSGGQFVLENILCLAFMCQYTDSLLGVVRPIILIFFNKRWFVASQQDDLILLASAQQGGLPNLYGTDGTHLYHLFDDSSTPSSWTYSTAYWDMDALMRDKQVTKAGFEVTEGGVGTITMMLDQLSAVAPYRASDEVTGAPIDVSSIVTWTNNLDDEVAWKNNALDVVSWTGGGYFMFTHDASAFGKYIGITMSSDDVGGSINSNMLEYTYRIEW